MYMLSRSCMSCSCMSCPDASPSAAWAALEKRAADEVAPSSPAAMSSTACCSCWVSTRADWDSLGEHCASVQQLLRDWGVPALCCKVEVLACAGRGARRPETAVLLTVLACCCCCWWWEEAAAGAAAAALDVPALGAVLAGAALEDAAARPLPKKLVMLGCPLGGSAAFFLPRGGAMCKRGSAAAA